MADLRQAHQLPSSKSPKISLKLAEHELDRVEIRSVRQVVNEAELEPPHLRLWPGTDMDSEVVHEQADLVFTIGSSQTLDVFEEPIDVDRPLEDLVVLQALLFRDATQQR